MDATGDSQSQSPSPCTTIQLKQKVPPLNWGNKAEGCNTDRESHVERLYTDVISEPRYGKAHIMQRFISREDPVLKKTLASFEPTVADIMNCISKKSFKVKTSDYYTNLKRTFR